MDESEKLAKQFHETYERLAPSFGYETRKDSAVPWEAVPEKNRKLMVVVCGEIAAQSQASLAAARAQTLEEVGKHCPTYVKAGPGDPHWLEGYGICSCGQAKADGIHPYAEIWREHMQSLIPSDSTALAKLLAEERLDEARWWRYLVIMDDESYFAIEGDKRLAGLKESAS